MVSAAPQPFIVRIDDLRFVRREAPRSGSAFAPAMARLIDQAEKYLLEGPFSVLDKARTAPSGDPKDYMSQGVYWWPNPNTGDGLPYVRRDGEGNPEVKELDHTGLGQMERGVQALSQAWFFTGDARFSERASLFLRTWFLDERTGMNPHLRYAQGIPGINDGRGIGIIDTKGWAALFDRVELLAGAPGWSGHDDAALRAWARHYLAWLLLSAQGSEADRHGNNISSWYDVQLTGLARFCGQEALAADVVRRAGPRRIAAQIEPGGSQPRELKRTRSLGYSVGNLLALMQLARMGESLGVDLWHFETTDGRSIRKALDYIVDHLTAESGWPHPEMGSGIGGSMPQVLRMGAAAYEEPRYCEVLDALGTDMEKQQGCLLYPVAKLDLAQN